MAKVLFLTGKLQNYRVPILQKIVEDSDIELTVGHSSSPLLDNVKDIEEIILMEKPIWRFTSHQEDLIKLGNKYDVVISMFYLNKLSFMNLLLSRRRRFKLAYWGIGVRASLSKSFDSPTIFNRIRTIIAKRADAMIFYTDYAKNKYVSRGIDPSKLFVMQNTVEISNSLTHTPEKDSILFVGTLYKAKKIFELLCAYKVVFDKQIKMPKLNIIGKGEEYEKIKNWIKLSALDDFITLHGAIYEEKILERHFKKSIATISPGQAGLSVLKSFGYGVPFITMKNAFTGGERLNIENGVNGVLYENDSDLSTIIHDIAVNKEKYIKMGLRARQYYENYRTPSIMASGFIEAVDYLINNK